MNAKKLTNIMIARRRVSEAELYLRDLMRETYIPGLQTSYLRGNDWIPCEVIECYAFDTVRVRGRSGKEYVINGYRMNGAWDRA